MLYVYLGIIGIRDNNNTAHLVQPGVAPPLTSESWFFGWAEGNAEQGEKWSCSITLEFCPESTYRFGKLSEKKNLYFKNIMQLGLISISKTKPVHSNCQNTLNGFYVLLFNFYLYASFFM